MEIVEIYFISLKTVTARSQLGDFNSKVNEELNEFIDIYNVRNVFDGDLFWGQQDSTKNL